MHPCKYPRVALSALAISLFFTAVLLTSPAASGQGGSRRAAQKAGAMQPTADYVRGELLVRFREDSPVLGATARGGEDATTPGARHALTLPADDEGGQLEVQIESFAGSDIVPGLRLGRVDPGRTLEAVTALAERADVLYAEPNYIYQPSQTNMPNDPHYTHPNMYGLRTIGAPQAWDITQGSSSVVVGVVDGGIDTQHEDLRDNLWVNPGETPGNGIDDDGNGRVDDVNGFNFVNNNGQVFVSANDDDHGTHVAGTIGARGNNGVGVTGVNWQVGLMSLKVCSASGCPNSAILGAYEYARRMKVEKGINLRALNNSYGGPGFSQSARDAIQRLSDAGILFVAAAGNDGRDNFAFPQYPSDYDLPNVLGVASTNSSDNVSGFSNFGPRVISMGAPGSGILSTTPRGYADQNTGITGANGSTYSIFGGTSMATPHVTGAAALVVAARPGISMRELRGVLAYSGDLVPSLSNKTTTGRRLNVFKAIQSALENDTTPPGAFTLQVSSQQGRGVMVTWTEPGDDGFTGQSADHDFIFTDAATGARTFLPINSFQVQPGTTQSASVLLPYLSFSGTLEMRVYDNAGNFSSASVAVNVGDNIYSNPYTVTTGAAAALSSGGNRLLIDGDDRYHRNIALPFAFPYFGQSLTQVAVSSNGTIYFTPPDPPSRETPDDADDVPGEIVAMRGQRMLAVMWDDLMIDKAFRSDAGVFMVSTGDSVIFRWHGTQYEAETSHVNFEAELRRDGTIIYRYGAGNLNLFPVVGIASGEPDPYIVTSHTSDRTRPGSARRSLTNAPAVTFAPRTNAATIQFSATDYQVNEAAGTATITITRVGNLDTLQSVGFFTDSGGTATLGTDYSPFSTHVSFNPGETTKTVNIQIHNDAEVEQTETVILRLNNPSNGVTPGTPFSATLSIIDDDLIGPNSVQFGTAGATVSEGAGKVTVTVTRTGTTTHAATVFYRTANGTASERSDYTAAAGTLRFGANETSKSFDVLLTDDRFAEGQESLTVTLSDPFQTSLGAQQTFTLNIADNDAATGASPVRWDSNFNPAFFVRQHYADFLNREPDADGLAFWQGQLANCGNPNLEVCRVNVSGAFFQAIEFQETGYLAYRVYKVAYGDATGTYRDAANNPVPIPVPSIRLEEFLPDTRRLGEGVVVNQGNWREQLDANKQAYALEFVRRQRFIDAFPLSLSAVNFVRKLDENAGGVLTPAERDRIVEQLGFAGSEQPGPRAAALLAVAENATLKVRETNRAFVLMQYFGYLRRNPNDAPDSDFSGWKFWLDKLNQFGGNYVEAEMVKAFITSFEYVDRFGSRP